MGFSEEIKLEVKRKSHYRCVICQSFGPLHIHHIIPEAEDGSDEIDNAVALCPSCHDIYQDNKKKRKWMKEKRDFWYEYCDKILNQEDLVKLAKTLSIIEETNLERDKKIQNLKEKIVILNSVVEEYSQLIKPLIIQISDSNEIERQNISNQIGIYSNIVAVSGVTMDNISRVRNPLAHQSSGYTVHSHFASDVSPHKISNFNSGHSVTPHKMRWLKDNNESENK